MVQAQGHSKAFPTYVLLIFLFLMFVPMYSVYKEKKYPLGSCRQ